MTTNIANLTGDRAASRAATGRSWTTSKETPDIDLMERIAAGNKLAMQVLYMRYHVRVFRFVLRFLDSETAAEDLVSEVFLDVWRKADKFEGRSQVSTWLLGIARNKALDARRQRPVEQWNDDEAALIEDPADNPEVDLQKKDTGSIMRKCLQQLSPAHRQIIDLVYYPGKPIEQVPK